MGDSKENSGPFATPLKGSRTPKKQPQQDTPTPSVDEDDSDESSASSEELMIDELAGPSSKKRRRRIKTTEAKGQFVSEGLEEFEAEIERQLGSKAKKSQLTIHNVKNILKHVITNQDVLAMVRKSMRDEGDEAGSSEDESFPFEPKLTRAKTKELLATQAPIPWPVTPVKVPPGSATKKLIDQVHEDSSDDEEYQPNEEETENSDDECNSSLASDLEQTLTPTPLTPRSITDCSTQTTWTEDGLFKMPNTNFELMETMGMRTRSKVSLTDIPLEAIEQSFIPPDITTDMYETECENEDWKQFLNEFVQPLNKITEVQDDDEADPEYNILEDEEAEDKEEMRADRAVKVSKKELNELISELMEYMEPSDDENEADASTANQSAQVEETPATPVRPSPLAEQVMRSPPIVGSPPVLQSFGVSHKRQGQFLVPASPVTIIKPSPVAVKTEKASTLAVSLVTVAPPEEEVSLFSLDQRLLLNQQMMQHVQLLTQSYMQSTLYPEYIHCAAEMKENILALKYLGGTNPASAFYAQNLNFALKATADWETYVESQEGKKEATAFYEGELSRYRSAKTRKTSFVPHLQANFMKTVSMCRAFIYPTLLPYCGFHPYMGPIRNNVFLPSEDLLIATAINQFLELPETKKRTNQFIGTSVKEACKYLAELVLPVKSERAIDCRVKLVKRLDPENPITTKQPPKLIHRVIGVKFLTPSEQPDCLLPPVWKTFIHGEYIEWGVE